MVLNDALNMSNSSKFTSIKAAFAGTAGNDSRPDQ